MKTLYPYLTYAGAIPFIFCALLLMLDMAIVPYLGSVADMISVYGLVIATFLAGAQWGQHLSLQNHWRQTLPIISNAIAILLWLGFLYLSFQPLMLMMAAVFLMLLHIDYGLYKGDVITRHYFKTRCRVTAIVVMSLLMAGTAV